MLEPKPDRIDYNLNRDWIDNTAHHDTFLSFDPILCEMYEIAAMLEWELAEDRK